MQSKAVDKNLVYILAALALVLFIDNVDATAVSVALPSIAADLRANVAHLKWVMNAYLIASAAFFISAGYLGDVWGARKVVSLGTAMIGVSSLAAALCTTPEILVAWRAIQGVGYALTFSMMLILLKNLVPEDKGTLAVGLFIGVASASSTLGPFLGGYACHALSWRAIFLINALVCPICTYIFWKKLPADPKTKVPSGWKATAANGFLFLMLLVFAILLDSASELWTTRASVYGATVAIALAICGVFFGQAFRRLNGQLSPPIYDKGVWQNRSFCYANLLRAILQVISFSIYFMLPLYLQFGLHYSVVESGAVFSLLALIVGVFSPVFGAWLKTRQSIDGMILGYVFLIMAALFGYFSASILSLAGIALLCVFLGLALAALFTSVNVMLVDGLDSDRKGASTGVYYTLSFCAGAVGVIFSGMIMRLHGLDSLASDASGSQATYCALMTDIFACWLGLSLTALGLALRFKLKTKDIFSPTSDRTEST